MATSFSRGYKIKLIGTGLEAGTWGTSTNENLKRVDQYLGGYVSFDITSATTPSSWNNGTNTLTWCLGDTTDAWEAGSEARNRFVDFTTASGDTAINVRGSTDAEVNVERIYWVRNSLAGSGKITLSSGSGGNLVLENGATALIYCSPAGAVSNILGSLQADGLDFRTASAVVKLITNTASSLLIEDVDTGFDYLKAVTTTGSEELTLGSTDVNIAVNSPVVDVRDQATKVFIRDTETNSLEFWEGNFPTGTNSYLKFDTSTGNESVSFGQTLKIDTASVDLSTQATAFSIKDDELAALTFGDTNGVMLTFDTNTEPEKIITASTTELEVLGSLDVDGAADFSGATVIEDLAVGTGAASGVVKSNGDFDLVLETGNSTTGNITIVDGADGQISLSPNGTGGDIVLNIDNSTAVGSATNGVSIPVNSHLNFGSTLGNGGYGARGNATVLQVSNTNSDGWGQPYHTGMVSGEGSYFESVISATIPGAGQVELPHSLGSVPRLFMIVLKIQSGETDDGFSELAEIPFGLAIDQGNGTRPSLVGYADSTNIGFHKHGSGTPWVVNSSGTMTQIDAAKWEIVARAWK